MPGTGYLRHLIWHTNSPIGQGIIIYDLHMRKHIHPRCPRFSNLGLFWGFVPLTLSKDDFGYSVCPVVANDSVSVKSKREFKGQDRWEKRTRGSGRRCWRRQSNWSVSWSVNSWTLLWAHLANWILNTYSPVTSVLFPCGHKKNEAQRIEMTCPGHRAIK